MSARGEWQQWYIVRNPWRKGRVRHVQNRTGPPPQTSVCARVTFTHWNGGEAYRIEQLIGDDCPRDVCRDCRLFLKQRHRRRESITS